MGFTPIIVDEATKLSKDQLEELDKQQKEKGFWLMVTGATKVEGFLEDNIAFQEMTIPPLGVIYDTMLGTEGYTECGTLGSAMASFLDACRTDLAQEIFYDFGLRAGKHLARTAGQCGKQGEWK